MFELHRTDQHKKYLQARDHFINHPDQLISVEKYICDSIVNILKKYLDEFKIDYDEASYLYPFWQNYPPENRGRKPVGDQFPWLEVGEHVFATKLPRLLTPFFSLRDCGLPYGPDLRLILSHPQIASLTDDIANSCWLFADVKSVGPRDDQEHAVMSHNQVSGDGVWPKLASGPINQVMTAKGGRASHKFHCAVPPIYVLSDGSVVPVVEIVIKPVYGMLGVTDDSSDKGQPLERIVLVTIPNGLLLTENPMYLNKYPGLFFPGKDDKSKDPRKLRARVSFGILAEIAPWRVRTISQTA